MCGVSHVAPTGDLVCNPGKCPNWESDWRPFGLQAGTQSTELYQPGWEEARLLATSSHVTLLPCLWLKQDSICSFKSQGDDGFPLKYFFLFMYWPIPQEVTPHPTPTLLCLI